MSDLHVHAPDPSLHEVAAELEALGEPLTDEERALIEGAPSDWLDSSADLALTAGLVEVAHGPGLSELGRRRAWSAVEASGGSRPRHEAGDGRAGRLSWVLGLVALAAAATAVAILVAQPPAGGGTPIASEDRASEAREASVRVDPAELEQLAAAARDGLLVLGLEDGDESRRARDTAKAYAARLAEVEGQG